MNSLFFYTSKIVWALFSPASMLFLLLVAGTILLFLKKYTIAKIVLAPTMVLFGIVAFFPVGKWIGWPLENRFTTNPELPRRVDGIIVLGGAADPVTSYGWDQIELGSAADRYSAFIELAKRYPRARLAFSGGMGSLLDQAYKEADIAMYYFESMGISGSRIEAERDSRNTNENVINSKNLIHPKPGENWVLITSAVHMPRAVGVFCKQDWPVIPWPVDHETSPGRQLRVKFDPAGNLNSLNNNFREWVGLLVYSITGKTAEFFPAGCPPQQ